MMATLNRSEAWPALPLGEWQATCVTLHMWIQIVGKVRLALSPHINHWWGVPLYLTARGLTTSPMPYGSEALEIQFDFIEHKLDLLTSRGGIRTIDLSPRTVADFYHRFMETLHALGLDVRIWTMPVEVPTPIRFEQDTVHASYDADYAHRFWRILLRVDSILKRFRSQYLGKVSPVHFFWGSFDLAVTRFSGRRAPERPGADRMTREAYSHEVISVGFWPGSGPVDHAAFYAYATPEPEGFRQSRVRPRQALYSDELHEFLLPYDDVRTSASPEQALLDFCQSTYEAGATLGKWDRDSLEKREVAPQR
ncbi:MAG TPA: DUF5996 family protein [Candidatus Sulfotelmatobacter sp.]|nr:DUF5996 family protein [Candidatus Sulfotelmatobacter sp.]